MTATLTRLAAGQNGFVSLTTSRPETIRRSGLQRQQLIELSSEIILEVTAKWAVFCARSWFTGISTALLERIEQCARVQDNDHH
jgi:hypothetical protein